MAVTLWLALFLVSACAPKQPAIVTLRILPVSQFKGISSAEKNAESAISDMSFDSHGNLYTLSFNTGRVTLFNPQGRERTSFCYHHPESLPGQQSIEAVAMGYSGHEIYVVEAKSSSVQIWSESGRFLSDFSLSMPIGPGDTTVTPSGHVLHNPEGFQDSSIVVEFNRQGKVDRRIGLMSKQMDVIARTKSLRRAIGQGKLPPFLETSVLLAAGPGRRIYVLYRARPVLQCYENGRLVFEQKVDFSELADIRDAIQVRNRVLQVPSSYIPFSYWSDLAVDAGGNIYILLALQTHHTIYMLSPEGRTVKKLFGIYGKGHLLAVNQSRLAVADVTKGLITIYSLPR